MQQVFRLTKYFGHIIYLFRIYLFICPGIPNEQSAFVRTDSGISLRSDVWCYLPFGKTIYQMAIKNNFQNVHKKTATLTILARKCGSLLYSILP